MSIGAGVYGAEILMDVKAKRNSVE